MTPEERDSIERRLIGINRRPSQLAEQLTLNRATASPPLYFSAIYLRFR
jgi:hypothetical protein